MKAYKIVRFVTSWVLAPIVLPALWLVAYPGCLSILCLIEGEEFDFDSYWRCRPGKNWVNWMLLRDDHQVGDR